MFIILKRRETPYDRVTQVVKEAGVMETYGVGVFIAVSIGKARPSKQFLDWLIKIISAASGI